MSKAGAHLTAAKNMCQTLSNRRTVLISQKRGLKTKVKQSILSEEHYPFIKSHA